MAKDLPLRVLCQLGLLVQRSEPKRFQHVRAKGIKLCELQQCELI